MTSPKLTARESEVLAALHFDNYDTPDSIANRLRLRTMYARETAAKYCIRLVRLGLAEKGGTRMFPTWRRKRITP